MNGVGSLDGTTPDYDAEAKRRDDGSDLDRLRAREAALSAAHKRDPGDLATTGALVRVQQAIRHAGGDDARLAQNTPPSQSAHEQTLGYGIRLPVSASDAAPVQLDRPVSHLSTAVEVKGEIDQISGVLDFASKAGPAFLANVDRRLIDRLGELQKRLPQVTAAEHAPATPTHVELTHVHSLPEAHEGNAPQIAAMHVELTAVLHPTTFGSSLEVMTYANQYINYTAKHPEMRDLHDHAVANFGRLVDEATERDRVREQGEIFVHDQVGRLQLRVPPAMEQMVAVSALGLLTAKTVHAIAAFVPVAGEVQAGLEALSGHGMWGLGEERIEGVDRLVAAVTIVCGLAPYARKILNGAETEEAIARIARESAKTPEEVRNALKASVKLDNEKATVLAAAKKARAGEDINEAEQAAVDRVRGAFAARDGIVPGDLVRTARSEPRMPLVEKPTGSWGGPGEWEAKTEHMPPSAAAYQERVTGVRAGTHAYIVDGADFDGLRVRADGKIALIDAKDHYAQFLLKDGKTIWFIDWNVEMVVGLKRKADIAAAHGAVLEVHCSESAVAARLRADLVDFAGKAVIVNDGAP